MCLQFYTCMNESRIAWNSGFHIVAPVLCTCTFMEVEMFLLQYLILINGLCNLFFFQNKGNVFAMQVQCISNIIVLLNTAGSYQVHFEFSSSV